MRYIISYSDAVMPWIRDAVRNVMPWTMWCRVAVSRRWVLKMKRNRAAAVRREQEMGSEGEEKWSGGSEAWAGDEFWSFWSFDTWFLMSRRWVLKVKRNGAAAVRREQETESEGEEKWSGRRRQWGVSRRWVLKLLKFWYLILDLDDLIA